MNTASTPSRGFLGPAKHWAKTWKLGIDKVQRDVSNSACGPAHTEQGPFVEGRMESDELGLGSWLPLDNATGKELKHRAVSSAKRRMTGLPSCTLGFPFMSTARRSPLGSQTME